MILMIVNLWCSLVMAICALWILTGQDMSRLVRIGCGLIVTGGSANIIGLLSALAHIGGYAPATIWPGEVIVNVGVAALMMRWTLRLRRHAMATTGRK
jgi:hypothetical protein